MKLIYRFCKKQFPSRQKILNDALEDIKKETDLKLGIQNLKKAFIKVQKINKEREEYVDKKYTDKLENELQYEQEKQQIKTDTRQKQNEQIQGFFFQKKLVKEKNFIDGIPINFQIKNLVFPQTQTQVLLLGVEKNNEYHASFLVDLLNQLEIDLIQLQISPDDPMFIKTEKNYRETWKSFIQNNLLQNFLISTNPKFLSEIMLTNHKIDYIFKGIFLNTPQEFQTGSTFFYRNKGKGMKVDCFLSALQFSHQNIDRQIPVVISDYPSLVFREKIVNLVDNLTLRKIFKEKITNKKNQNFDSQLLLKEIFIEPKIEYLVETIKHSCHVGKRIAFICDNNLVDFIVQKWRELNPKLNSLQSFLNKKQTGEEIAFVEYIERHVLLDLILDQNIHYNFVQYKSFPFSGENTLGREMYFNSIFIIWDYYRNLYQKSNQEGKLQENINQFKMHSENINL